MNKDLDTLAEFLEAGRTHYDVACAGYNGPTLIFITLLLSYLSKTTETSFNQLKTIKNYINSHGRFLCNESEFLSFVEEVKEHCVLSLEDVQ